VIELLLQAERALALGLVDHAERLYRQAIAADPRNAIAVVGLARVALEHADDAEAYRRAKQALEIDPENVAAIRLSGRLEEVFAHRGTTPPVPRRPSGDAPPATTTAEVTPAGARTPDAAPAAPRPSLPPWPRSPGAAPVATQAPASEASERAVAAPAPGAGARPDAAPAGPTTMPAETGPAPSPAPPPPSAGPAPSPAPPRPQARRSILDRLLRRHHA